MSGNEGDPTLPTNTAAQAETYSALGLDGLRYHLRLHGGEPPVTPPHLELSAEDEDGSQDELNLTPPQATLLKFALEEVGIGSTFRQSSLEQLAKHEFNAAVFDRRSGLALKLPNLWIRDGKVHQLGLKPDTPPEDIDAGRPKDEPTEIHQDTDERLNPRTHRITPYAEREPVEWFIGAGSLVVNGRIEKLYSDELEFLGALRVLTLAARANLDDEFMTLSHVFRKMHNTKEHPEVFPVFAAWASFTLEHINNKAPVIIVNNHGRTGRRDAKTLYSYNLNGNWDELARFTPGSLEGLGGGKNLAQLKSTAARIRHQLRQTQSNLQHD